MRSAPYLLVEKVWEDNDVVEIRFAAVSERFAGAVEVYVTYDELSRITNCLRGFPASHPHRYEFHFRTGRDGNSAVLAFETADTQGHCWAIAKLIETERSSERATVAVAVEPAAIDRFVDELNELIAQRSTSARLVGDVSIGASPHGTAV